MKVKMEIAPRIFGDTSSADIKNGSMAIPLPPINIAPDIDTRGSHPNDDKSVPTDFK